RGRRRLRHLRRDLRQGGAGRPRRERKPHPADRADDGGRDGLTDGGAGMTDAADLADLCGAAVRAASGEEAVEAFATESRRTEVRARKGEVESLTTASGRGLGIRLVAEGRLGYAWVADPTLDEAAAAVGRARENA